MDHTFWQSIADNNYAVHDGHSADELALEPQDGLYARLYRMQFEAGMASFLEAGLD